jgi:hypothetical protein
MPEAPKANHLSTVVQSELFNTDIEKLSAQGDECRALFQSPRVPVPVRRRPPGEAPLAGVFALFERSPNMSNLAQSSA